MTLHDQKGFTLIEALVAIAIFSIGFLAVAAMQTGALSSTTQSRQTTEALEVLSSHVEFLHSLAFYPDFDFETATSGDQFDVVADLEPDLAPTEAGDPPHTLLITHYPVDYTVEWEVTDMVEDSASPSNDLTVDSIYAEDPVPIFKVITIRVIETATGRERAQMEIMKVFEQDIRS